MRVFKNTLVILLAFLFVLPLVGCDNGEQKTGYDGRTYDISVEGNGAATLSVKKVGTNYELTLSGNGSLSDYTKKEDVPWNVILKKVTVVTIEEGITSVGDYYFSTCNLTEFFLPSTVVSLGEHSFPSGATLYSYAQGEFDTDYTVYYYSAIKPSVMNKYFRLVDGAPKVWHSYSILFIGNSFTFRQGSEEEPMVPYLFGQLADNLGETVSVDFVVRSSYTLTKYADPTDEKGAIVEQKLTNNQYDFIVLQEQSTTPVRSYSNFKTAVGKLTTRIGQTQTNAEVFLYATWGYPSGLTTTTSSTVAEMNSKLKTAYDNCGAEYGVKVNHIGDAFLDIYTNHSEIELYASDDMHQTNIGAYLSACCHICSILDIDVRNATFTNGYSAQICEILRETAYVVSFVR